LWLITVLQAAAWLSDSAVSAGDQAGSGMAMVAVWRIRSAVLVVPWQRLVTVSEPPGIQRGAREFGGIACSSRISVAETGW
jgi:hypothetical protein